MAEAKKPSHATVPLRRKEWKQRLLDPPDHDIYLPEILLQPVAEFMDLLRKS